MKLLRFDRRSNRFLEERFIRRYTDVDFSIFLRRLRDQTIFLFFFRKKKRWNEIYYLYSVGVRLNLTNNVSVKNSCCDHEFTVLPLPKLYRMTSLISSNDMSHVIKYWQDNWIVRITWCTRYIVMKYKQKCVWQCGCKIIHKLHEILFKVLKSSFPNYISSYHWMVSRKI